MDINKKIYLNVSLSIVIKIFSMLINFLTIPIYLKFLGKEIYGVWLIILSILSWITICDIGLGNGLKVFLTEALTLNKLKRAKEYIATTYFFITGICLVVFIIGTCLFRYIDISNIFNINLVSESYLKNLMIMNLGLVLINFVLIIINQVNYAMHNSALVDIRILISQILNFILVFFMSKYNIKKDLILVAMIYNFSNIFINLIGTILVFYKNKFLLPSIKNIKISRVKDLTSLGTKFFILQIMGIVIFTLTNILISRLLNPKFVTEYNIILKVFSIIVIFHQLILTPLIPAYTKAMTEKDFIWIKKTLKKLFYLEILVIIGVIFLIATMDILIKFWLGNANLFFSLKLKINFGIYSILSTYSNIHAQLYAGMGKLNFSILIASIQGILIIPLSVYLVKGLNLQLNGIILAINIILLLGSILFTLYTLNFFRKEIKNE